MGLCEIWDLELRQSCRLVSGLPRFILGWIYVREEGRERLIDSWERSKKKGENGIHQ